jgi:hypothetical protein
MLIALATVACGSHYGMKDMWSWLYMRKEMMSVIENAAHGIIVLWQE